MKKSEAIPGTKVLASYANAFDDHYDDDEQIIAYRHDEDDIATLIGVIRSQEAKPGKVWVKWIKGDYLDGLDEQESEVDLKILVLESDRPNIERDFKSVSKEIKQKMKDAAKLIREANSIAKKAHLGSLADMYDAVSPLVDAMDASGWRSSSWGC